MSGGGITVARMRNDKRDRAPINFPVACYSLLYHLQLDFPLFSPMAPKVALSHQAYVGILLHTARHASETVNGVLLGSAWQDEISVQRTIPLLHHWTSLSPMMEIGLDLVR